MARTEGVQLNIFYLFDKRMRHLWEIYGAFLCALENFHGGAGLWKRRRCRSRRWRTDLAADDCQRRGAPAGTRFRRLRFYFLLRSGLGRRQRGVACQERALVGAWSLQSVLIY